MLTAWILALAVVSLDADLTVQRVIVEPAFQTVASGDTATLTVVYDSVDPTLTGLGVRLHYDSSKITLEDAEVLFGQRPRRSPQDQEDIPDHLDGDPATDRRYLAAWSSLLGQWPGNGVTLPLEILRLTFRTHGIYPSTRITVTGDHCARCSLETHSGRHPHRRRRTDLDGHRHADSLPYADHHRRDTDPRSLRTPTITDHAVAAGPSPTPAIPSRPAPFHRRRRPPSEQPTANNAGRSVGVAAWACCSSPPHW